MTPIVAFDVGSTLIHPDMDVLAAIIGLETTGFERRELAQAFTYALEADQKVLPMGDCIARQGHELLRLLYPNNEHSAAEARDVWLRIHRAGGRGSLLYTEVDPDAHDVLAALRYSGCRLVAASNSDGTLRDELEQFGLAKYFEHFVDSRDIGFEKPEPHFFGHVLSLYPKEDGGAAWYIGNDIIRDVLGALIAGFDRAVFYDRADAYPRFKSAYRIGRLLDLVQLINHRRGVAIASVE